MVGTSVRAFGAGVLPMLAPALFNVAVTELVNQIVPLEELWGEDNVHRMFASHSGLQILPSFSRTAAASIL